MAKAKKQFKNLRGIPKGCPLVTESGKKNYVSVVELCECLGVSNVAVRNMLARHNVQPKAYEHMRIGVGYRFFYDKSVMSLWTKFPKQYLVGIPKLAKTFGTDEKTVLSAINELKLEAINPDFGLYEKKTVKPALEKHFWGKLSSGKTTKQK